MSTLKNVRPGAAGSQFGFGGKTPMALKSKTDHSYIKGIQLEGHGLKNVKAPRTCSLQSAGGLRLQLRVAP